MKRKAAVPPRIKCDPFVSLKRDSFYSAGSMSFTEHEDSNDL